MIKYDFSSSQLSIFSHQHQFTHVNSLKEMTKELHQSSNSLDLFIQKWQVSIDSFINSIPNYDSTINPFLYGLTGDTLFINYSATVNDLFAWNSSKNRPLTIYESFRQLIDDISIIDTEVKKTLSLIEKIVTKRNIENFIELTDTRNTIPDNVFLVVNNNEDGLEYTESLGINQIAKTFISLRDTPCAYPDEDGYILTKGSDNNIVFRNTLEYQNYNTGDITETIDYFDIETQFLFFITVDSDILFAPISDAHNGYIFSMKVDSGVTCTLKGRGSTGDPNRPLIQQDPFILDNSNSYASFIYDKDLEMLMIINKES